MARIGGHRLARQFLGLVEARHAGRIAQHRIGQHSAGGDGVARRGARGLAQLHRLVVIALGIGRENLFHGCAMGSHRQQQEQRGQRGLHFKNSPASADRIIAAVLAQPNSAVNEPKRGPSVWPSSTSYKAPNQARSGSKP